MVLFQLRIMTAALSRDGFILNFKYVKVDRNLYGEKYQIGHMMFGWTSKENPHLFMTLKFGLHGLTSDDSRHMHAFGQEMK